MSRNGNRKLRIGIVGAGGIVKRRHLPGIQTTAGRRNRRDFEFHLRKRRKVLPGKCSDAVPIANWPDLVALPDIDIVWIGTPPYMHSAVTVSALEAGKHVFCQARMANDRAEAEEMLAASRRFPKQVTMLCPPPYGLRGDRVVKKLLAENFLGQLHTIRLQSFNGNYLNPNAPAHWRQRIEISGLNVHDAWDLRRSAAALVRRYRWIVCARKNSVSRPRGLQRHHSRRAHQCFATSPTARKACSSSAASTRMPPAIAWKSTARPGRLVYDFTADVIKAGRVGDRALHEVEVPTELAREWTVENDFLDAVKAGDDERPYPTFEDGVRYMRVVQAVADSRARNEWITITP